MASISQKLGVYFIYTICILFLCQCGIVIYPGQPGRVTQSFSKIDMENLEMAGLFVYEVSYDNTEGGGGVGAIVTKLYPGAKTFTASVRTNADGSVFRSKEPYAGAVIQMISMPQQEQVIMPPDSQVIFLAEYELSLDEIDDSNQAELELFTIPELPRFSGLGWKLRKFRWDLLKLGSLQRNGTLSYAIERVGFKDKVFSPTQILQFRTNLFQTGVQSQIPHNVKLELKNFIETHFPKGFKGEIALYIKGSAIPINVRASIHTLKTAKTVGWKIEERASEAQMRSVLDQIRTKTRSGK